MSLEEDGREVTVHCANPGSMMGLAQAGARCWIEPNDDPGKKLRYAWRLVEHPDGHFTGVDTNVPNRALKEALAAGNVPGLAGNDTIRPEVRYGDRSRIDFLLSGGGPDTYVEVKSVTLSRKPGLAEFPDSVTARGARHLDDLARVVSAGHRGVILFLAQRTDASIVTLAPDIDPAYARSFGKAVAAGVEVLCLGTTITRTGIDVAGPLPFSNPGIY